MPSVHHHFSALLKNVNPNPNRAALAASLPNDLRQWLREHDFQTASPHTRLSGSYARDTAIGEIKDIDVLLFVPDDQLERTPNAVLMEVKRLLDAYPGASAETSGQRRSVHLEFPDYDLHLDIVPAVAAGGVDRPIEVPDRTQQKWLLSDPLGYARALTRLNQGHGGKVVPLMKLVKAWRDVQMTTRRPKSYVLEVMVFNAICDEEIVLVGNGTAQNFADFVSLVTAKYDDLMENGNEAPRITDPQVGSRISAGWDRGHFETFMRRAREADALAQRALTVENVSDAACAWKSIFGSFWPSEDQVKAAARQEAATVAPGRTAIASQGFAIGAMARTIPTQATRFHGDR